MWKASHVVQLNKPMTLSLSRSVASWLDEISFPVPWCRSSRGGWGRSVFPGNWNTLSGPPFFKKSGYRSTASHRPTWPEGPSARWFGVRHYDRHQRSCIYCSKLPHWQWRNRTWSTPIQCAASSSESGRSFPCGGIRRPPWQRAWPDVLNRPSWYVWGCQVCPTSYASKSNSLPGDDWLTVQPLSLPEFTRPVSGGNNKVDHRPSLSCSNITCSLWTSSD